MSYSIKIWNISYKLYFNIFHLVIKILKYKLTCHFICLLYFITWKNLCSYLYSFWLNSRLIRVWVFTQLLICYENYYKEVLSQCSSSEVGYTPYYLSCCKISFHISPILKCGYNWITYIFCCYKAFKSFLVNPTL